MEVQIALCLPRDAATANLSRQVLDSSLEVLGVAPDTRADVSLALSEACANVILHASDSDEYEVRVRMMDARCVIEVVDTGHGFDASTLSDTTGPLTAENGRGLQIIRALAQNLKIENQPQHGAIVRFEIPLEWVPGSPATFLATETGTSAR